MRLVHGMFQFLCCYHLSWFCFRWILVLRLISVQWLQVPLHLEQGASWLYVFAAVLRSVWSSCLEYVRSGSRITVLMWLLRAVLLKSTSSSQILRQDLIENLHLTRLQNPHRHPVIGLVEHLQCNLRRYLYCVGLNLGPSLQCCTYVLPRQ